MWCKKRITNLGLLVRLENTKQQFYIESVCGNRVEGDAPLCEHCTNLRVQDKVQYNSTFPHGFVDGPYTKESHIYDSPWYHANVEAYGPAPKSILDLAMEAQRRARAGIRVKTITDCLLPLPNDAVPKSDGETPKSVDTTNSETPKPEVTKPEVTKPDASKPKPKKQVRKSSSDGDLQSNPINQTKSSHIEQPLHTIPTNCTYIESTDTPIPISNIQRIKLTKLVLNSQPYWFDTLSNNVFAVAANGKKGPQVGCIVGGQFVSVDS